MLVFSCSKSIIETPELCEIYSKLIKTLERRQGRSGVFIVNFERILNILLVFPLLTLNKYMPAGKRLREYPPDYCLGVSI